MITVKFHRSRVLTPVIEGPLSNRGSNKHLSRLFFVTDGLYSPVCPTNDDLIVSLFFSAFVVSDEYDRGL